MFNKYCVILTALLLTLSSCKILSNTTKLSDIISGKEWVLRTLNGNPLKAENYKSGFPQLKFEETRITGYTGCNNLSGSFHLENENLSLKNIASTRKFCEGVDESSFLKALNETTKASVIGNTLLLSGQNGELLQFEKK